MADSRPHPYISGPKNISKMVERLRQSSHLKNIDTRTVEKYGIAPKNERYVINALQFIGIIDKEGKKTDKATEVLSISGDKEFSEAFSELVKISYATLFELYGEAAWSLSKDDLVTFFRTNDRTSDATGELQAATFRVFAGLSGIETPAPAKTKNGVIKRGEKTSAVARKKSNPSKKTAEQFTNGIGDADKTKDFGLTVRVEFNLPANGNKETYDNIFKSIKENLIDG